MTMNSMTPITHGSVRSSIHSESPVPLWAPLTSAISPSAQQTITGPQVRSLHGPPYQTSFDPPRLRAPKRSGAQARSIKGSCGKAPGEFGVLDEVDLRRNVLEFYDQLAFGRKETLPVHLHEAVAVLLKEFQDPAVEIVSLFRHVGFDETGGGDEPASCHLLTRELAFDVVEDRKPVQKVRALFLEDILITASISDTEELDGLSLPMVPQRNPHPRPVVQGGGIHLRNKRNLPLRFEVIQQQAQRGRVLPAAKHARIDEFLLPSGLLRRGWEDWKFFTHAGATVPSPRPACKTVPCTTSSLPSSTCFCG